MKTNTSDDNGLSLVEGIKIIIAISQGLPKTAEIDFILLRSYLAGDESKLQTIADELEKIAYCLEIEENEQKYKVISEIANYLYKKATLRLWRIERNKMRKTKFVSALKQQNNKAAS